MKVDMNDEDYFQVMVEPIVPYKRNRGIMRSNNTCLAVNAACFVEQAMPASIMPRRTMIDSLSSG
jgi:hypothetical protein